MNQFNRPDQFIALLMQIGLSFLSAAALLLLGSNIDLATVGWALGLVSLQGLFLLKQFAPLYANIPSQRIFFDQSLIFPRSHLLHRIDPLLI